MPVVLLVVAVAILCGVVLVALGRVGEMAPAAADIAPIELDEVSATDVALLRPPMSLWGYNAQVTDDALRMIARSVTARDVEIAALRRELADLRRGADGAPAARATRPGRRPVGTGGPAAAAGPAGPLGATRRTGGSDLPGGTDFPGGTDLPGGTDYPGGTDLAGQDPAGQADEAGQADISRPAGPPDE